MHVNITPSTITGLQSDGWAPTAAPLFFELPELELELDPVALDAKPAAALKPLAEGLNVGAAVPPDAVAVMPPPSLGIPVAVCETAALAEAAVAEGMAAPRLGNDTTLLSDSLNLVCARAIRLLMRSYTT